MNSDKVTCAHILKKHNKSRTPLDRYRNIPITRSKDEALDIINKIRNQLITDKSSDFSQLANEHSECSSAANGGNLGEFGKGEMQKEFEDVAFALEVGGLSEAISTDSGIHIILRLK